MVYFIILDTEGDLSEQEINFESKDKQKPFSKLFRAKNDILNGGGGADEFKFGTGAGTDRIKDFIAKKTTSDEADIIKVLKNLNGETIETAANVLSRVTSTTDGALINLGGGNTILLEGVNSDSLTAANFAVVEVL